MSVSILQPQNHRRFPSTLSLKQLPRVVSVSSPLCSAQQHCLRDQEITKPGPHWWFHFFCNGQWSRGWAGEVRGAYMLSCGNCQAWAQSSPTSSWQGSRLCPYISRPANPVRRPNGFIKNNVITGGLFCRLSACGAGGGEPAGLPMQSELFVWAPDTPCPVGVKKRHAEWKEHWGGGQDTWLSAPAPPYTGSCGREQAVLSGLWLLSCMWRGLGLDRLGGSLTFSWQESKPLPLAYLCHCLVCNSAPPPWFPLSLHSSLATFLPLPNSIFYASLSGSRGNPLVPQES